MKLYVRFFTFFYVFLRFFQNPKKHDFLRFFELLHTFSRTVPPLIGVGIKRRFCVTSVCLTFDVCLSRTLGLSREQRGLGRPKLAQRHVIRDSDTTFKVKRSRSPGRFAHCHVGASGGCSGRRRVGRGKLLLRCRLHARRRKERRLPRGRRGAGTYRGGRPPIACFIL